MPAYCDNVMDFSAEPCPQPLTTPYKYHGCVTSVLSDDDGEFPYGSGTCTADACVPMGAACPY